MRYVLPGLLCPRHVTDKWIPTEKSGGSLSGSLLRSDPATTPNHATDDDDDDNDDQDFEY